MDLFELQENLETMFGPEARLELDGRCVRQIEVIHDQETDEWHAGCHIVYDHACVVIGETRKYLRILPHRATGSTIEVCSILSAVPSFKITQDQLKGLKRAFFEKNALAEQELQKYCNLTKMTPDQMRSKLDAISDYAVISYDEILPKLVAMCTSDDMEAFETELQLWCSANGALPEKVMANVKKISSQVLS